MFCTLLVLQSELMEGFTLEEPESKTGKILQVVLAIMGSVSGLHEHCWNALKTQASPRRKLLWALGWLLGLFVFVSLSIVSAIHGW